MLQLDNRTPYAAERAVLADLDGSEIWVIAVKATFDVRDGACVLADEQVPVCLADEYVGEPGQSSLRYENELAFRKPGTDVVVLGHAYAPDGRAATRVDASVAVGPVRKTVRVTGPRVWESSGAGLVPSSPGGFERMPLVYERAFGGVDASDPERPVGEDRNPIGTGFGRSADAVRGQALPNLEVPDAPVQSWKDRPPPAGFGPVAKHWMPRRPRAGTYDAAWQQSRMPFYPLDFDPRFFQNAPDDLVATPHLRGGERVEAVNLTPDGHLSFVLPRVFLSFRTQIGDDRVPHSAKLGSVILEPDVPRVQMVWQTFVPCTRRRLEIVGTRIVEKEATQWT